jgi:L-malate glycosyltransferase
MSASTSRRYASAAGDDRRLRVCLVGPSLDILGGQAVQLQRLRERLDDVGELDVSFLPVNPRLPGLLRPLQRIKFVRTVVTSIAYVVSLLRHLRTVDVVHAFSASYWSFLLAPVPALLVGRLYRKAVIINYHSGEADDHLTRSWAAVPLLRLASAIAVPSGYLVSVFRRHGLNAQAIFNFVEIEGIPYRHRTSVRPRFLSNRNLEPLYNVDCTLRAFSLIQREIPDAQLVIAGDGSQRSALERRAAELQLRQVTFVGRTRPDDMPALYDAADVYLNASDIDNMPISIIEAFAAGLPVATTDAGGIPYIVEHESNGLMVARGDHANLAAQATRLIREPGLASRLAQQARHECLERYVWPSVRDGWLRLYAGTMQRGLAPSPAIPSHGPLG